MNPVEIADVLEKRGALLRGHFALSSGRHSDLFVQKFRVLEDPALTRRFGEAIATSFAGHFDVVASPAVGAIVLGFATALEGGARFVFAERAEGSLVLRRGFEIRPRERVLIVEDVLTTGSSASEVVRLVDEAGGEPVGVGCLIDRGDPARPPDLGVQLRALLRLELESWEPERCPLCREGEPLQHPGSRRLAP